MALPAEQINDIIEEYDLGRMVGYLLKNNPSFAAPYHSHAHCLRTTYLAKKAWDYSNKVQCPVDLLIAALWHDFGHFQGFYTNDYNNVVQAEFGFRRFHEVYNSSSIYFPRTKYDPDTISRLILGSVYPPHQEALNSCRSVFVRYLLDADYGWWHTNTMWQNLCGIKQEYFRHIEWQEYLEKSIEFFKGLKFYTPFGQEIVSPELNLVIKETQRILDFI